MNLRLIIVVACNLGFTGQIVAPCTFSTEWDGLWYDSRKKEVTLSQTASAVLSGWTVNAYASSVTSWTCVEQSADSYLMKGDQNVDVFGSPHSAYLCLRVALVTDVSFTYTIQADEQSNAGGERVTILPATTNASLSGDCVVASPPGPEEYHVLVKADNVSNVRQYFPEPLLAVLYNSAFVKTGPVCDSDVILDMCSDRSTMNRTECSAVLGQVLVSEYYCVAHVQDGANFYVSLLNPRTTGSNQQHFLCLAVTKLNSQVYISDNIGSCAKGQDPGVKQPNGTEALVMYASVLCPFETSTAEETSDVGLIVGSVIASLVILGLILAITIVCLRKKCRDKIRTRCCSRCGKKSQHNDSRLQMSEDESSSSDIGNKTEVTDNANEEGSSLFATLNKSSHTIGTNSGISAGSDQENGAIPGTETAVTSDQELSVSAAENMEFGKAPIDVRKDVCFPTVQEPAVTSINELKDSDDQDVMLTSGKNSSQFLRQKTEDDMAELRRINERVNLAKNSVKGSDMTSGERIYFEKSVFAKQNVEAEMYLKEEVSPDSGISSSRIPDGVTILSDEMSADRDYLSSSLSAILEGPEQSPDLNLVSITSASDHAPEEQRTDDLVNREGKVIEEFDFSLTEEQISARSRLSTAMSFRVTSGLGPRRVSPAGPIVKGLRESIGGSKRTSNRMEVSSSQSRGAIYSITTSSAKAKRQNEPMMTVPKPTTTIPRARIKKSKYKLSRVKNGPNAPKMKFRWV